MTDSPIYQDLHPWVDNVNYWFRNLGQGDKECMVVRSTWQIQNKIDLREVLCARETGQLPTNPIMFSLKLLDTKPPLGWCCNKLSQPKYSCPHRGGNFTRTPHPPPPPPPQPPLPGIFNFHKELKILPPLSGQKPPNPFITPQEGLSQ